MEADDSGSEQVPVEGSEMGGQQHVALVTQEDGTQQQVRDEPQELLRHQEADGGVDSCQSFVRSEAHSLCFEVVKFKSSSAATEVRHC